LAEDVVFPPPEVVRGAIAAPERLRVRVEGRRAESDTSGRLDG